MGGYYLFDPKAGACFSRPLYSVGSPRRRTFVVDLFELFADLVSLLAGALLGARIAQLLTNEVECCRSVDRRLFHEGAICMSADGWDNRQLGGSLSWSESRGIECISVGQGRKNDQNAIPCAKGEDKQYKSRGFSDIE